MLRSVLLLAAFFGLVATAADATPRPRHAHHARSHDLVVHPGPSYLTGGGQANFGDHHGYALDSAFANPPVGDGPAFLNLGGNEMLPNRFGASAKGFSLSGF